MDWKKILIGGGLTAAAPFTGGGSLAFLPGALAGAGVGTAVSGALDGSSRDTDAAKPTDELTSLIASLKDSSAANRSTGKELTGLGAETLAPILDYFKQIMGNDPSAVLAATGPERGRVIDQYDTARKSIATFAPRGGQSGAAISQSYTDEAQALSDLTTTAKRDAAGKASALGTSLTGLGLTAEQIASGDLNTIIQAILQQKNLDLTKSGQNKQLAAGLSEALGTMLGLYLTRGQGGSSVPAAA